MSHEPAAPHRPPLPMSVRVFRVGSAVVAAVIVLQAASAGQLLVGSSVGRAWHEAVGHLLFEVSWVVTVAGLVAWRRHGLPGWGALAAGVLPILVMAQVVLGHTRMLQVHVPLGVSLLALSLFLVWTGFGVRPAGGIPAAPDGTPTGQQP